MKNLHRWIVSAFVAASLAAASVYAGSQNYYSSAQNQGKNETFYFTAPATCSISSIVGLNNPNQPAGGGGGSATVTLINITTVYTVAYGNNMSGSNSASASNQASGSYKIAHYTTAGSTGAVGYASTTFNW